MSTIWRNLPAGHGVVVLDAPESGSATLRVMTLRSGSIVCERCASRAADMLAQLPGVHRAALEWDQDQAVIVYEARHISGNSNGTKPSESAVAAWAIQLIAVIDGEARTRDHEKACGGSHGPRFLV